MESHNKKTELLQTGALDTKWQLSLRMWRHRKASRF